MRATWRLALLLAVVSGSQPIAYGVDASNVLVLYNSASSDGAQIANYYASVHPARSCSALMASARRSTLPRTTI